MGELYFFESEKIYSKQLSMKNYLLFICLLISSAFDLTAQVFLDVNEAKAKLLEAREVLFSADTSQFQSLIQRFENLEKYFFEQGKYVEFAQSFAEKSELRMRMGESRGVIDAANVILVEIPSDSLEARAIVYTAMGYAEEVEGLYEGSLLSFNQAIELLEDFDDTNYHKLNANLGRANIILEKWGTEEARVSGLNVLEKLQRIKEPSIFIQHLKGRLCLLLGDTYTYSFSGITPDDLQVSQKYFEEGLRLSVLYSSSEDNLLAGLINNSIGYLLWIQYKKFSNSHDLLKESENKYKLGIQQLFSFGGLKYPVLGRARNNLAMTYQAFWDRDMFANIKKIKSNIDQSNLAAIKTDSIWTLAFEKSIATYKKTLDEYTASLDIKLKALNPKHPYVIRNYTNLGSFLMASKKYTQSLEYLNLAILSNLKTDAKLSINNFENIISLPQMLHSLRYKAFALEDKCKIELDQEKRITDLKECLETYELIIGLLEYMISGYIEKNTQIYLLNRYEYVYESAISICLELLEQTKEISYNEKALVLIEKSKANLSRLLIRENEALKYIDIAYYEKDSIFRKEIDSLSTLSIEEERSTNPDKERIALIEAQLNNNKAQHGKLISQIEKGFPEFKNIKYKTANPSLSHIRSKILSNYSDSTAILDYFMGKNNIVIATVTKDDLEIIQKSIAKKVDTLIQDLRDQLSNKNATIGNYKEKYLRFKTKAHELYKYLFEDCLSTNQQKEINNLVVIPSGNLSLFPMELLLTKEVDSSKADYGKLPYLLHKFNMSYAYSLSLLEKSFEKNDDESSYNTNYVGFACTDLGEDERVVKNSNLSKKLEGAKEEVILGESILNGRVYLDENATEKEFRKLKGKPRVLQLAMHTKLDLEHPGQSKFLFCGGSDKMDCEDGDISANELYGLSNIISDIELAMLTACNTGKGRKINGEGIVSLSQAFTNLNCKSTLMSLWLVNDKSTPKLTKYFFKNLKDGLSKSEALRQAKISYLKAGKDVHPYYWASLLLSGNDLPMEFENKKLTVGFWVFGIIALVVILSVLYLILKKIIKHDFLWDFNY